MDMKKVSEKKLILKAKKDISAFGEIYEKYFPKINNFLYHRVKDDATKNEIVSNIFFKMMNNLPKYRFVNEQKCSFSSWLFRIAINETNQYFRSEKRNQVIRDMLREKINNAGDKLIDLDYDSLKEAIQALPLYEQNLISLRFFEKMKYKEIAEILKQKEGTIKVQMHRTLEKLRDFLQGDLSNEKI
ncbi:MAG: sigma-70 family RNA polymerase sigma factor [Candidatus Celaenobacter antarcticus]|nr:sigma-70 family RNA polymerase sigma factor [Candidatus Celaenobacter antarcticus]MDP8313482.1 sigma-70 family RNA polymerase sigma factor [Candidatus Celaenobacter antarcticus]